MPGAGGFPPAGRLHPGLPVRADLGLRQGNADFGLAALVATPEAIAEYLDHPAHKDLFSRVIAPMCESRTAVQIEVDSRPGWQGKGIAAFSSRTLVAAVGAGWLYATT